MLIEDFSVYLAKWVNSLKILPNKCTDFETDFEKCDFIKLIFLKLYKQNPYDLEDAVNWLRKSYPNFEMSGNSKKTTKCIPVFALALFDCVVKRGDSHYQHELISQIEEQDHAVYFKFFSYLLEKANTEITYDSVKRAIASIGSDVECSDLDCSIYETSDSSQLLKSFFETPRNEKIRLQNENIIDLRKAIENEEKEKYELSEKLNEATANLKLAQEKLVLESKKSAEFRETYEKTILDNKTLIESNAELEKKISSLTNDFGALQKEFELSLEKSGQVQAENNDLLDRIYDLTDTIEEHKIKNLVYEQEVQDVCDRNDKLFNKIQLLEAEKNELLAQNSQLEEYVKEINLKTKKNNLDYSFSFDDSFSNVKNKTIDGSTQSEKVLKNLHEELLETECSTLKSEIGDLKQEILLKKDEIEQLKKQVSDQLYDNMQNVDKIEMIDRLNTELLNEIKEIRENESNLKSELSFLQNELKKLNDARAAKAADWQEKERQFLCKIEALQNERESKCTEVRELAKKLETLSAERNSEQAKTLKTFQQYRDEFSEINVVNRNLRTQNENLRAENEEFKKTCSHLQFELENFKIEKETYDVEIVNLKSNLESFNETKIRSKELISEITILKSCFAELEQVFEQNRSKFDLSAEKKLNLKLEKLFGLLDEASTSLIIKDSKIEELQSKNDNCTFDLKNMEQIKINLETSLESKIEEEKILKSKVAELQTKLKETLIALNDVNNQNGNFDKELKAANQKIANLEIEYCTIENLNLILDAKLKDLESGSTMETEKYLQQMNEKSLECEQLNAQISELRDQVGKLNENLTDDKKKLTCLQNRFENENDQFRSVAKYLNALVPSPNSGSVVRDCGVQNKFDFIKEVFLQFKKAQDDKFMEKEHQFHNIFNKLNEEKALLMNDKALLTKSYEEVLLKLEEERESRSYRAIESGLEKKYNAFKAELTEKFQIEKKTLIESLESKVQQLKHDYSEKLKLNNNYKQKYEQLCDLFKSNDTLFLKEYSEEQQKRVLQEKKLKLEIEQQKKTILSQRDEMKKLYRLNSNLITEKEKRGNKVHALESLSSEQSFANKAVDRHATELNQSAPKNILDFAIDNENIVHEVKGLSRKTAENYQQPVDKSNAENVLGRYAYCLSAEEAVDVSRLCEIQERNSYVLPHLKSSYPAETQFVRPSCFEESEIKAGAKHAVDGSCYDNQSTISSVGVSNSNSNSNSNCSLLPKNENARRKDAARRVRPISPIFVRRQCDKPLRELNVDSASQVSKKISTPTRIRQLFNRNHKDKETKSLTNTENEKTTQKSRKLNFFRH